MWCAAKKNEHLRTLLKRAKANLRTCIAQNEKRLTFPELFAPILPQQYPKSKLQLSTKYNLSDIIELASAMDLAEMCCRADGSKASFKDIVETFEHALGIKFSDCYEMRRRIAMRKTRKTSFLDTLVNLQRKKMEL